MSDHLSSYPSIYAVGHRAIKEMFDSTVIVEEKIDGSQFSMARIGGELVCRSKGQQIVIDAPEKMFSNAVDTALSLDLHEGWVYRCEYLKSPKHNTLTYGRIPVDFLAVFDICTGLEEYLNPVGKLRTRQPVKFKPHLSASQTRSRKSSYPLRLQ